MSTTAFSSPALGGRKQRRNRATLRTSSTHAPVGAPQHGFPPFVDLPESPFARSASPVLEQPSSVQPNLSQPNPVADLIPDELFVMLRMHDLINEMGIRNYVIRRFYHELREVQALSTAEAMEQIQDRYPYLQLDTIRKIVYRIGPPSNRKGAF